MQLRRKLRFRGTNSLDTISPNIGDLHRSESKMAGLLDRRDNSFMSQFKFRPNPTPRAPTPPQIDANEVDDAGSMDYRFEEVRLQSFENWPSEHVRPADLAAAGFYFTKQIDRVRCFECSTEICRWEQGDDPMVEHQRWGGRCRFIRKLPCGNVPIGADANSIPAPRPRSRDVCGPYRLDYRLGAEADSHASSSGARHCRQSMSDDQPLPSAARLGCMGIGIPRRPDFPDYASYEARLLTFSDWPTCIAQTKEQLADAGFFYTGTGDQTTCYHCGGGLKNWEPKDDPWVQHAKWFSTCFYVRLVKGQEFINNVNGKHVSPLSEEERMALPSCIKNVEAQLPKKIESEDESQQQEQNQQNELNESKPGPSSIECPIPKPRTGGELQTEQTTVPMVNANSNASASNVNEEEKSQQPNEKKSFDDARVCKICYNEELGVVFLPCGHMVACVKCAPGMTTCAVCREPVAMTVRAFFS